VSEPDSSALRATVTGRVQGVGFRDATAERARELGLFGWVRNGDDGAVLVHAEGSTQALDALLDFLHHGPPAADVESVTVTATKLEGHEQFAVRGVAAGTFVVRLHRATTLHFDLRLELAGAMLSWALPKGPTMDPATQRLAIDTGPHEVAGALGEGPDAIVWDAGEYEQGGRVPWPEALDRGHAVFVLHGRKLRGGFALQRTSGEGPKAQWLLIKRRDEEARPGSDVVAEQPLSILSDRSLG
jgi:DNA ligase D-like protein (predicted 3'-phosphoesterase)